MPSDRLSWPGTGSLPQRGHMGDDAPDAVGLVVDAQDAHGDPGAAGWPAALGVGTQAVDAAVQGHEDAGEVHQAHGAYIAAAHGEALERLLIGVLAGLLHRDQDPGLTAVGPVHLQDLYQHPLAGLVVGRGVDPALVGELLQRDIALRAEQIHEDARPDDRDHPRFGADALVELVVPVPVGLEVVFLPLLGHGLQAAGHRHPGLLVDALDDVVHLRAQALIEQVVEHVALGLVPTWCVTRIILHILTGINFATVTVCT